MVFTGIVEEIGIIRDIKNRGESYRISIQCSKIMEGLNIGHSICVNGICLTVTEFDSRSFLADVMPETLRSTNLADLKIGGRVNLERAMSSEGRFGGHLVSGHIDGVGIIKSIITEKNAVWFTINAAHEILRYVILKGSIAIDGISLTVQHVDMHSFKISIIPHSLSITILQYKKEGDKVNIECDMIGKYVLKFVKELNQVKEDKTIDLDFLLNNGF